MSVIEQPPGVDLSGSQALGITPGTPADIAGQLYGYIGWASQIPEVDAILKEAAAAASAGVPWSQAQMDARLKKTDWYRTTNDAQKAWLEKESNNPAQAATEVAQKADTLRQQLMQQGVAFDEGRIANFARDALRFGWDDIQFKAALDSELLHQPNLLASVVGTNYRALAEQYAVNLSDSALQTWASHSISGVRSDQQFVQYLRGQAKSRFSDNADLTDFLDRGGTVDQYFDTYKQDAAQTLGIDPSQIHLTDPKWTAAINSRRVDDKGKETVGALSRQEWIQKMKEDPQYGWSKTANGINELQATGQGITALFGGLPGLGA